MNSGSAGVTTGKKQDAWNPAYYSANASFVYTSVWSLIELVDPRPGERVLDLGCGTGELSLAVQDFGCEVVSVDSSPAMVKKAQEKGLDARVMDGHDLSFVEEFDAVFSNAALHWMRDDPGLVVQNVARSLKPNGRFVAEFGGERNLQKILDVVWYAFRYHGQDLGNYNPWYFPTKEKYIKLLESHGMRVSEASLFPRATPCPAGPMKLFQVFGGLEIFGGPFVGHLQETEKQTLYKKVEETVESLMVREENIFTADYVRLRFSAAKKE